MGTIVSPLRELAKPGQTFNWTTKNDKTFDQVTNSFRTVNTLAYFNPGWDTDVYSDASPVRLGAIIVQVNPKNSSDQVVVASASRALSTHEKKNSQVELEALALIFAASRRLYGTLWQNLKQYAVPDRHMRLIFYAYAGQAYV